MDKDCVLIDLDGVILDSEELMLNEREKYQYLEWDDFFDCVNWFKLYSEAKSINDSVEIITELESLKKDIVILTKSHTMDEMRAKVSDLRNNRKIKSPILLVPPHIKKSEIYIPINNEVLIDDSKKNIDDWNRAGGKGILFDTNSKEESKNVVKSLHFLLRK